MLIGHEKIWQFLKNSLELNKMSHAYFFSGQEKLGKKTLAVEFAKWLFKEDIIKKQHPDFIFIGRGMRHISSGVPLAIGRGMRHISSGVPLAIEPLKKEIQISQIKECIWRMNLKPSIAPFKIAIIDEAHCLNEEAQNSLLKTLEEPKGQAILFLISEYPERLFPTILSRCQTLKFYPVKKEEILNYLRNQKITQNEIEEIIKNSAGKPGLVIDFLSDPEKLKTQKAKISDLIKILNSDLACRFQYASDLSKESQNLKETLSIWLGYFREILISNITPFSGKKYSFNELRNITKFIQETNFLISTTNVNPRLALEILMMEL